MKIQIQSLYLTNDMRNPNNYLKTLKKLLPYGKIISEDTYCRINDIENMLMFANENFVKSRDLNMTLNKLIDANLHNFNSVVPNKEAIFEHNGLEVKLIYFNIDDKEVRDLKLLNLLYKGIALDEELVRYTISEFKSGSLTIDKSKVSNKEFLFGILEPKDITSSRLLLEFILSEQLGITMLVVNPSINNSLKNVNSEVIYNILKDVDIELLSKDFLRYKKVMLSLKRSPGEKHHKEINKIINRISKRSKVNNVPIGVPKYLTLTSKEVTDKEFIRIISDLDNSHLLKVYEAFKVRELTNKGGQIAYRVRTGSEWVKEYQTCKNISKAHYIRDLLLDRFSKCSVRIHNDDPIVYTVPNSLKKASNGIPDGSYIPIDNMNNLVLGVYWENDGEDRIDLDLSAQTINGKIGWNSQMSCDGFTYSGDVQDGKNGATEMIKVIDIKDKIATITINGYKTSKNNFKFFIGYFKDELYENVKLSNIDVVYSKSYPIEDAKELVLGHIIDGMFIFDSKEANLRISTNYGLSFERIELLRNSFLSKPLVREFLSIDKTNEPIDILDELTKVL